MKNKIMFFVTLSMFAVASPVLAAHDHGSMPMGQGAPQAPVDDQNAKESELIINKCEQYIGQLHQRIQTLQMEIKGKHVATSVRDELKKLELNLKEANDIARSLQIM